MPLPWKKSKSSRISRFVTDLQQSPKHGGSLVVETGFPTSLIDLFVKNRDRLKKTSSKRINNKPPTPQIQTTPSRRRIEASSPPIPPLSLARYRSLPLNLDTAVVLDDPSLTNKIEESLIPPENIHAEENNGGETLNSDGNRGGGCVLMVAVFKVFMVAVLALSAKKLAVGITISAFALLFLELAVTRVFTYFNLCPNAHVRIDSLIEKLIGNRNTEKLKEEGQEEEESISTHERRNKVSFEIIEEPKEEEIRIISQLEKILSLEKTRSLDVEENKEVEIIRYEKSKSQRLKSKIVKKIVPKKLRSYKKKKKMKKMKQKEEGEEEIEVEIEEEEEEEYMTEVSSLFSEERNESEISERDNIGSNLPLLEGCGEIEEEEDKIGTKGDVMKVMSLIVIVLVGLLCGKVFAIGLTLSWCLILRSFCCKSQNQTSF